MKKFSYESIGAISVLVIFTIIATWLISFGMSTKNSYLILLGIFFIIIEIRIEYSYLQKTNIQVRRLDKKLKKTVDQAQMTIEALQTILKQMERLMPKSQMPNVLSDIYSKMENQYQQELNQLVNKLENFESRIGKLEKTKIK